MRITVYTTDRCPFCHAATRLLQARGLAYEEIHLAREQRDTLTQATGGLSFPQIVIDGQTVGGFDELRAMDRAGGLR